MAQITNAHTTREIELILYSGNTHYEARSWNVAGVECRRERHRYTGQGYAFSIEILQLRFLERGRPAWEAMIVNENWATGSSQTAIRGKKWMKLISGKPTDVRAWVRRHRLAGVTNFAAEEAEVSDLDI